MSNELVNTKPDYLKDYVPQETSDYAKYIKTPILKVVQYLSGPPFVPPFVMGDALVTIDSEESTVATKVADMKTAFSFVVIDFFPTFAKKNPGKLKGQVPKYAEIDYDEKGPLADKARKFVKVPMEGKPELFCNYVTMLNFAIVIQSETLHRTPVVYTCDVGEYKYGQDLLGMLQRRRLQAPEHACLFRAKVGEHKSGDNKWYGLDIDNDPDMYVNQEKFIEYGKLSNLFKSIIRERKTSIDYDAGGTDSEDGMTVAPSNAASKM